ncbi:MAG TPA: hypothetical protein VFO86_03285, partial [Terriglobia bacterium]|nr:hypothetical protein [Terriglobia bacterium]
QQQKVLKVPTSPEEVVALIGNDPDTIQELSRRIADGENLTQAVEAIRLKQATTAIDKAEVQSKQAKKKAETARQAEYRQSIDAGNKLIDLYTGAAKIPDHPQREIGQIVRAAIESGGGEMVDVKYTERVARVLYKWQTGQYNDQSAGKLRALLKATEKTAKLSGSDSKVVSYKVDGKRVSGTQEELQRYIEANQLTNEGWSVMSNEKGRLPFIGKRVGKDSLDRKLGEGEKSLGDTVAQPLKAPPVDLTRFKVDTDEQIIGYLDTLIADPKEYADDFMSNLGESEATQEQTMDLLEELVVVREALQLKKEHGFGTDEFYQRLNARMKELGIAEFTSKGDMQDAVRTGTKNAINYVRRFHNLETPAPLTEGDRQLAESVGLFRGPQALFEHIAAQKETLGPIADIVEAQMKFANWNDLRLILPGQPGWVKGGWSYTDLWGFDPQIVVPRMPTQETMGDWLIGAAHEFVHYNERMLANREDAPAKQYRQTKSEILTELRNSKVLPKEVRDLIAKSLREKHWDRLSKGDG